MKPPRRAPRLDELLADVDPQAFEKVFGTVPGPMVDGRYLHWDKLRYREPPEGLSHRDWWLGLKLHRSNLTKPVPLLDKSGRAFRFAFVDPLPERMHHLDFSAGGQIKMPEPITNPATKREYLVRSLIEEAFTSSQLEGARTTREAARELIRKGRRPRDTGERMVLNNYRTMEHILALGDEPLSKEVVFEIQRVVTEGTLDDPSCGGRLRRDDEYRVVGHPYEQETVYHEPPEAGALEGRMELMCRFANGLTDESFLHPAIRSMMLHFWLAYDHPFVDGNGRTARVLFYWSMLRHGYWLFEYVSISSVILKGPMKYLRAFLDTETDDNDLTYFLLYHSEVVERAITELHLYLERKTGQLQEAQSELRGMGNLNHRQRGLIVESLRHPGTVFTVESHRRTHGVVTQTARNDLLDLVDKGYFKTDKVGRMYQFQAVEDLSERLRRPEPGRGKRKTDRLQEDQVGTQGMVGLNHRQRELVAESLRHPGAVFTVESHRRTHGVVTQTARTDLLDLVEKGLLRMEKVGRSFQFQVVEDLSERLRNPKPGVGGG